jgi:hypothetical protein
MLSVITNIYNKKTKGPTLMELFTATRKLNFCLQLEMFDLCTTGNTAHIDTMIVHEARIIASGKNIDAPMLTRVWQKLVCRVTGGVHIEHL